MQPRPRLRNDVYHLPSVTAFVGQRHLDHYRHIGLHCLEARLYLLCVCAKVSPNYIENAPSTGLEIEQNFHLSSQTAGQKNQLVLSKNLTCPS